jgi:hypothetical protein
MASATIQATPDKPENQVRMQRLADQRTLDRCKAFNEIMTGPNPLTRAELASLIAKMPERYGMFARWLDKLKSP